MLRLIQRLSQDEGINLEGIRRILHLENELEELRAHVSELVRLLAESRAAPPAARVFAADPDGGVHLAGRGRVWTAPRAITSR
jgi:MerR family transcriptional regulator/heat shock protein HspR